MNTLSNQHPMLLVIAVQLGTKSCSVAFQYKTDIMNDLTKVNAWIFSSEGNRSIEFPTSLLLAKTGNLVEFGYDADKSQKEDADGAFFEQFGESLYLSEDLHERTLIKDSKGNNFNAMDVFSKFIKSVSDYVLETFEKQTVRLKKNDVKWILNIPSVRADTSAVFFQEGWRKAGISDEPVTIVTYPNAALNYCVYLPAKQCNNVEMKLIKKGERILVVGFEEELDSFNVFEKVENDTFRQVVHFLSNTSVRDIILKSFDNFLGEIIGSWIWKCAKKINTDLWPQLCKNVDSLMAETQSKSTGKITFKDLFLEVEELCKEHLDSSLKQILLLSEYSDRIKYRTSRLTLEYSLIDTILEKGISKTVRNIKHAMSKSEVPEVSTIALVGNMAVSRMLRSVQKEFPEKQIFVPDLEESRLASLKGAVLFGYKPIVVISSIFSGAQCLVPRT